MSNSPSEGWLLGEHCQAGKRDQRDPFSSLFLFLSSSSFFFFSFCFSFSFSLSLSFSSSFSFSLSLFLFPFLFLILFLSLSLLSPRLCEASENPSSPCAVLTRHLPYFSRLLTRNMLQPPRTTTHTTVKWAGGLEDAPLLGFMFLRLLAQPQEDILSVDLMPRPVSSQFVL